MNHQLRYWTSRKINDFIHSFCYACRKGDWHPCNAWLLCGQPEWAAGLRPIPPSCYVKFAWYAAKHDSRLLRLQDMMRHVFTQCPCNTPQEWAYAEYILDTYYGCNAITISNQHRSDILVNSRQTV